MDYEWIFDGIGSSLIIFFLGLIVSGYGGYKYSISSKQKQDAGNNSTQRQLFNDTSSSVSKKINQIQHAGDNSTQIQEVTTKNADK